MKKISSCFLMTLCLLATFSCQRDNKTEKIGSAVLDLSSDQQVQIASTASTPMFGSFDPTEVNDYKVEIFKQDGSVERTFAKFSEMPEKLSLKVGTYTICASLGENLPSAFESPYFMGEKTFVVQEGQTTEISMTASLANAKLTAEFTPDFRAAFETCELSIYTDTYNGDLLAFGLDETRAGYFKIDGAGEKLNMAFLLKIAGKGAFNWSPAQLPIAAKDWVKLKFNAKLEDLTGKLIINITVDETTIDYNIDTDVPNFWLPVGPPTISATNATASTHEGVKAADITQFVTAPGKIKNCILQVNAQGLIDDGTLQTSYDLANLNENEKTELSNFGFQWTADMRDKTEAIVNYAGITDKLKAAVGTSTTTTFTLTVIDAVTNTQTSAPSSVSIEVKPPVFEASVPDYDSWATFAVLNTIVTNGDPALVTGIQISEDNSNWQTVSGALSIDGNKVSIESATLLSDKVYHTRALYGVHTSDAANFRTETVPQLQNNEFTDWSSKGDGKGGAGGFVRYPYNAGQDYWQSVNLKTATADPTGSNRDADCYNSTEPTTGRDGANKAALIRSIGWSNGAINNAWGSDAYANSAGKLFLGSYSCSHSGNSPSETYNYGRTIESRPMKIQGYYKYSASTKTGGDQGLIYVKVYNGNTLLGQGELNVGNASGWTQYQVPISYTDKTKVANRIVVMFASSKYVSDSHGTENGHQVKYVKHTGGAWSGTGKPWIGSSLTIDNVQLVYSK